MFHKTGACYIYSTLFKIGSYAREGKAGPDRGRSQVEAGNRLAMAHMAITFSISRRRYAQSEPNGERFSCRMDGRESIPRPEGHIQDPCEKRYHHVSMVRSSRVDPRYFEQLEAPWPREHPTAVTVTRPFEPWLCSKHTR